MNNAVIISLTTIPERLSNTSYGESGVYSCIKSLCEQDYKNYEIHFNIPLLYKLHNVEYIIPEWVDTLKNLYSTLKIFRVDDEGPSTKILPTLRRTDNSDAILIVVDDDMVYRSDMVKEHVKNHILYENCAFGYDGLGVINSPIYSDIRDHFVSLVPQNTRVKTLQHYKSVSYKRKYFQEDFFTEFVGKTTSDDVLLSAYMGSKDIHKMVMKYDDDPVYKDLEEWGQLVGKSFPLLHPISHDPQQGCSDPKYGQRFYVPFEFVQNGYLEK